MEAEKIYEEKIFSKGITIILAFITFVFLFLLYYQIFVKPIGNKPAPDLFYLIMFLIFLGIALNFSKLTITITQNFILVRYGILKKKIPFEDVENCNLDERSNIRYGGFGIRIARVRGKWVLVYNLLKCSRVVLKLRKGRFGEFVFSTKNADEVMMIIRQQIDNIKPHENDTILS